MRISDWSSDVCSSDLAAGASEVWCTDVRPGPLTRARSLGVTEAVDVSRSDLPESRFDVVLECTGIPQTLNSLLRACARGGTVVQAGNVPNESRAVNLAPLVSKEIQLDRKSVVWGTSVSVRVSIVGRLYIQKKT